MSRDRCDWHGLARCGFDSGICGWAELLVDFKSDGASSIMAADQMRLTHYITFKYVWLEARRVQAQFPVTFISSFNLSSLSCKSSIVLITTRNQLLSSAAVSAMCLDKLFSMLILFYFNFWQLGLHTWGIWQLSFNDWFAGHSWAVLTLSKHCNKFRLRLNLFWKLCYNAQSRNKWLICISCSKIVFDCKGPTPPYGGWYFAIKKQFYVN